MNWKEEIENSPKVDKEAMHKMFIKQELMRYYLYVDKLIEYAAKLNEFMVEYREAMNNPCIGGSFAKMPEGSNASKSVYDKLQDKKYDLETNLEYYENKLKTIDRWINFLSPEYQETVKVYVIEYQCTHVHEASLDLRCEEITVKKRIERSINRIYSNFSKIL